MTAIEEYPSKVGKRAAGEKTALDIDVDIVEGNIQSGNRLSTDTMDGWGEEPEAEPGMGVTSKGAGKPPSIPADRPVFTLSVAADLLGLHPRTLRIYEEKQLVVPTRTAGNRRRYSPNDINRFHSIRKLTGGGVNLEGVRIILAMADELARLGGDPTALIERNLASTGTDVIHDK